MEIHWTIQADVIDDTTKLAIFNVIPSSAILKPYGSKRFDLAFRPTQNASYFF